MKKYSHKHTLIVILVLILSFIVFRSVNKDEPIPLPETLQGELTELDNYANNSLYSASIHAHLF